MSHTYISDYTVNTATHVYLIEGYIMQLLGDNIFTMKFFNAKFFQKSEFREKKCVLKIRAKNCG
mgnify:CR=1 FL=1